MKDPERLLSGDGTPAERLLLGAGAAEEPPPGGAARLAALLAPTTLGAPGPSAAPPAAGSGAAGALGAKWAMVAAGAVALGGAALAIASRTPPERPAPPPIVAPAAVSAPEPPAPAPEAPSVPVDSRDDAAKGREVSPRRRSESGAVGGAPSIAREIRTLDQVRALLARGEGRRALAELDRYRTEAPRGALGQEATLLRIEALVAAGDKQAARRLAQRFLSEHPGTPHEKRVRALTGAAP